MDNTRKSTSEQWIPSARSEISFSAFSCLLSLVDYLLSIGCCQFFVVSLPLRLLSAVSCQPSAVSCLMFVFCCLLSAVCCLLSPCLYVCCLLASSSLVCCLLSAVCCLLSTVYSTLSAVYHLLTSLSAICFFCSLMFAVCYPYTVFRGWAIEPVSMFCLFSSNALCRHYLGF
jgi:hypothetical protein